MEKFIETVPAMKLEPQDIDKLMSELEEYHAIYSPLYSRREQREQSARYLQGLLLDIPDKAIEPMVLAQQGVAPNEIRARQHFVSAGVWADEGLLKRHWQEVDRDLGETEGVFTLDGSDFAKQGADSVGVKRQYCGELGKVANCQAGVFLGYASRTGYTLLDRRLYLPKNGSGRRLTPNDARSVGCHRRLSSKPKRSWGRDAGGGASSRNLARSVGRL